MLSKLKLEILFAAMSVLMIAVYYYATESIHWLGSFLLGYALGTMITKYITLHIIELYESSVKVLAKKIDIINKK